MEKWKSIKNYEGLYEISNMGNVRSLKFGKEKIMSLVKVGYKPYLSVLLYNGGIRRRKKVHRLVAEAFIENNDSKPSINHKDNDKFNNKVENLEWCTQKENIQHAVKQGRLLGGKGGANHHNGYPTKIMLHQRQEIKDKYASGMFTHKYLAGCYDVSISTIKWVVYYSKP